MVRLMVVSIPKGFGVFIGSILAKSRNVCAFSVSFFKRVAFEILGGRDLESGESRRHGSCFASQTIIAASVAKQPLARYLNRHPLSSTRTFDSLRNGPKKHVLGLSSKKLPPIGESSHGNQWRFVGCLVIESLDRT